MKISKYNFKNFFSGGLTRPLIFASVFGGLGIVLLLFASAAAGPGLKAANNPKDAMGVSGTVYTSFARWLGRDSVQDIKFGETNKHFSPNGIDAIFKSVSTKNNRTTVVTINPLPDHTNFLPDRSKDPAVCGTIGKSSDATKFDYNEITAKYKGEKLAKNNLGSAKRDNNKNGINDNIENLHRAVQGCYDNTYKIIADAIVRNRAYEYNPNGLPQFVIRFGHEFDGDFYEWSATNQDDGNTQKALNLTGGKNAEQLYKEVWQRANDYITSEVRKSDKNAKIHWEFNSRYRIALNGNASRLERIYPGDKYVDVIGIDFYDRLYSNANCTKVEASHKQVPDCRTNQEKTESWAGTVKALDAMSDFAASRNKLIGVSEVHVSTSQRKQGGVNYWQYGADNDYFVQQMYNWVNKETTNRKRLAYVVFFERNGQFSSKELGSDLGAADLKSIHKVSPGASNDFQVPAGNDNVTCALEWDFYPLGDDGEPDQSQPKVTHKSLFPKSAKKFLQLWSGPINKESKKSDHPNCVKIGVGSAEEEVTNTAPQVSMTSGYSAVVDEELGISASVSDDGLPNGSLNVNWSKSSGPGAVTFSKPNNKNTEAVFNEVGNYELSFTANDGELETTKKVAVEVTEKVIEPEPEPEDPVDPDPEPVVVDPEGQQFTLLDATVEHTGTGYVNQTVSGPTNWTSPANYKGGTAYARLDVSDIPETNDRTLLAQICLYRDSTDEQMCSGTIPFSNKDVIYATIGTPSKNWFKKNKSWNFNKKIDYAKIQIKDAETKNNLLTENCGNSCTTEEIASQTTPITLNMQVVMVARNSNIEALPNWLNDTSCPIEFGCAEEEIVQPPTVRLNNPQNDLVKEDFYTLVFETTSSVGISGVDVLQNSETIATLDGSSSEYVVDTASLPNGDYEYQLIARDVLDNSSDSGKLNVQIRKPDIDGNGRVGIEDLVALTSSWNEENSSLPTNPAHDLNGDGVVGYDDLTIITESWTK